MPVCLHCGEIGPEGALFCGKCGYTLPQPGVAPTPGPAPPAAVNPPTAAPLGSGPNPPYPPVRPPLGFPAASAAYIVPASAVPGAAGPIAPPPNAKYCVRCATLISVAAVYCPVCQQPQR